MKSPSEVSLNTQKYGNKTFEFITSPPIIASSGVTLAYGIEMEGRFTELPAFAGGTTDRSYVQLNLAIDGAFADRVSELETSVRNQSAFRGDWNSSVVDKGGVLMIKVRLDVTSANPTSFRVGGANLCHGWPPFKEMLDKHGSLRGANVKVVLRPQKVWEVQGKVGITWKLLQIDFEPCPVILRDYFAH
jgi:hypothetical protein